MALTGAGEPVVVTTVGRGSRSAGQLRSVLADASLLVDCLS
jgi:hypothetical protein